MLFITIIFFILCKAILAQNEQLPYNFFNRISAIALLFCSILSLNSLHYESLSTGIAIFGGFFHLNTITQLMESFLFIAGSIILVSWPIQHNISSLTVREGSSSNFSAAGAVENISFSIKENFVNITNYSILILFNCLGASLLISSFDFISMYLSIELQSFSLYILATLYKESELATSAGLKYFLLGGFSSCLILLGTGLVYAYTGLTDFESLYALLSSSYETNSTVLNTDITTLFLGFIIIFVGFLFKVSAAPFHNWAPDVYDESPTIVTTWLTIIPKISIFMFLLGLFTMLPSSLITNINSSTYDINYTIKNVLLFSSLLSLIIGSVVGIVQKRIKRLLAYSTISHVGFILLALAIHSEQSIDSFLFYIIQYTITNLNMFLIILSISYIRSKNKTNLKLENNNLKDIRYITELKNLFVFNPLIALALSICLFSMAGIPPLIGFFSKQFVLYSSIESGHYFMSFVAIFVSVISAYYYLTIIKIIHLTPNEEVLNTESASVEINSDDSSTVYYGVNINNSSTDAAFIKTAADNNNLSLESNSASNETENIELEISSTHSFMISTLTLSILFFILKPSLILNGTLLLSLSLFNF